MSYHVCQITTVHPRKDGRIFHKECTSLAEEGYRVTLLVNDGQGDEQDAGVHLVDIGGFRGRIKRVIAAQPVALYKAWKLKADIYHFHDPELIGIGFLLSLAGKKVVYDVHEDLPNDIMAKAWIKPVLRRGVSRLMAAVERVAARRLAACVCVVPAICERFEQAGGREVVMLRNYPVPSVQSLELDGLNASEEPRLCYAGTISDARGLRQMVELAALTQTRLCLMGPIRGVPMEELEAMPGWQWVDYLGTLSREEVEREYMRQPAIGLVILLPGYGYEDALPIKLFEYMLFGLPVICSHFPLWESIVEEDSCGISVDPEDMQQLAAAVVLLKSDSEKRMSMARLGRKAVLEKYSWTAERKHLFQLYEKLLES